jgi:hypothetical protein
VLAYPQRCPLAPAIKNSYPLLPCCYTKPHRLPASETSLSGCTARAPNGSGITRERQGWRGVCRATRSGAPPCRPRDTQARRVNTLVRRLGGSGRTPPTLPPALRYESLPFSLPPRGRSRSAGLHLSFLNAAPALRTRPLQLPPAVGLPSPCDHPPSESTTAFPTSHPPTGLNRASTHCLAQATTHGTSHGNRPSLRPARKSPDAELGAELDSSILSSACDPLRTSGSRTSQN